MKSISRSLPALALLTLVTSTLGATFKEDVDFLKKHTDVIVLRDASKQAQVALVADYQGRIMTSTATGPKGRSHGWVNRELIASGKTEPHINVFGGEDRFWLGPEGGQYSIFFGPEAKFDLEHWFTPAAIDTEPFTVAKATKTSARFTRDMVLTNYSGTILQLNVDRTVRLVDPAQTLAMLGATLPPSVSAVGVESVNQIRNTGPMAWKKETGLLSIWILGMFNASEQSTVIVPFVPGPESTLGNQVNDTYFGKVPADRLVVHDGVLFFRGDAQYRSKIGISPSRARSIMGSYDAANHTLTLVQYTLPLKHQGYVNSMWELQEEPFGGDVVNSYNDGPSAPGAKPLGQFYELESSSPALALQSGETAVHTHRTLHLEGPDDALDAVAIQCLGVSLSQVRQAFDQ
ncbi:MAG: DUF6786 family protein [Limisphaerales bacterium]